MEKRKVLFKRYIKTRFDDCHNKIEGTGCYEPEFSNEGVFHQWASLMIEGENNFGNYTVGIIELPDGTIEEVEPTVIKFIK